MTFTLTTLRFIAGSLLTLFCAGAVAQQTPRKSAPSKPATSQDKKTAIWQKEPDAFMGIRLGESLTAQVPECAKRQGGYGYDYTVKDRCFRELVPASDDHAALLEIDNSPEIGLPIFQVRPFVVSGDFEGMHFLYDHFNYLKMYELFLARYGEPTSVNTESFQTTGGASFAGNVYVWQGKNVTITVNEYGSQIDKGLVTIVTKKYYESVNSETTRNADRNKNKL